MGVLLFILFLLLKGIERGSSGNHGGDKDLTGLLERGEGGEEEEELVCCRCGLLTKEEERDAWEMVDDLITE